MWARLACIIAYRNLIPLTIKCSVQTHSLRSFLSSPSFSVLSIPFLPYLIGFPCTCRSNSLMNYCSKALYDAVSALFLFLSLFFALLGGFSGEKRSSHDLLGFFRLYPCLSSLVSAVSSRLFHVFALKFMFLRWFYLRVCQKFLFVRLFSCIGVVQRYSFDSRYGFRGFENCGPQCKFYG